MTTNNPPIAAWAPSTALAKLESRHNNAPCVLTDGPAEFNDVALVRLADYEALQAACEEELFQVRQDRDAHFGELMRALEQVDALQAECERLRKDAERLDFIAQHPGWLRSHKGRWGCVSPFTNYSYPVFKTPRDAIDAAMEERNP